MFEIVTIVYLFCACQYLALGLADRALGFDRPGHDGDQDAVPESANHRLDVFRHAGRWHWMRLADAPPGACAHAQGRTR
jgi:hypothetical protein